jgi:hypothetical protein
MSAWVEQKLKILDIGINLISADLLRAIALHAAYARCADKEDVLDALNNTLEAHGFGLVREALFRDLVMSLMRIHDGGRSDTASLENLMNLAADYRVRDAIIGRAVERTKNRKAHLIGLEGETPEEYEARRRLHEPFHRSVRAESAQKEGEEVARLLDKALESFEQLKSAGSRASLRRLRNWSLAHSSLPEKDHKAKYGDEQTLLEATIPVFETLALAVTSTDHNLSAHQRAWNTYADRFWKHVAQPVASKKKQLAH